MSTATIPAAMACPVMTPSARTGHVREPMRVAVLFDSAGFLRTLPLSGAAARTVHLNAALHAEGCPTTLLLCDLNPDSRPSTDWPIPTTYLDYDTVYGDPSRLTAMLRSAAADVLVMSNTELVVRYGRAVADAVGAALIYEMHDDETAMLTSIGAPAADCRAAALLQGAAAVAADGVIAFSERDVNRARELGAAQVHLVPCGAAPTNARAPQPAGHAPARVGFVGNLHYEPNLRALRYLTDQLAPHLTGRAVIDVFGRYPAAARAITVGAPAGQLTLHGPVADLPAALSQMTIGVAPLDSGGGMKLKTLDYLAAGLPFVGTTEAVIGLERPEHVALLSRERAMRDLPGLVDQLLADPQLRHTLSTRGRDLITQRYSWSVVATAARHAYQAIHAARSHTARSDRGTHSAPLHYQLPREIIELASRAPYWLAEWRSRDPRLEENTAPMTEHPNPGPSAGELAEAIDCARLAATAALDITFDTDAAAGYAGRSMVFFSRHAVLKIYTHRADQRAHREVTGLELAAHDVAGLRIPAVLGHDHVPGGLSWVATTRLGGSHPSADDLATTACATQLGTLAARLHAIPAQNVTLAPYQGRRLRALPATDAATAQLTEDLVVALEVSEAHQRARCEHGFVHGDLSSRNVLLAAEQEPGLIDFEGSGAGCLYDDLATLIMQDGQLGPADPAQLLTGYEAERATLGHHNPAVDRDHLAWHLARRARWILQWAIDIDQPLATRVLDLAPELIAELSRSNRAPNR